MLLLAMIVPIRGVLAATMPCLPSGGGTQAELRQVDHSHHEHAAAQADAGHDHDAHHPAGASGKCTLCSACCSSASLLTSQTDLVAPPALSSTTFPGLSVPAATFLSGGQERPPRTI
ncbi:DUF2946 family protein [Piscinibacter sp. XHJ-5]|uniref:DUF2946 family protein n=1 Tax=Piscinibacter sp. XHJ-5 TaxID=3037797 RepID=UPI002452A22F|nr:DUF2946 family protein [Piscinibacter sp. XHJ-5]